MERKKVVLQNGSLYLVIGATLVTKTVKETVTM